MDDQRMFAALTITTDQVLIEETGEDFSEVPYRQRMHRIKYMQNAMRQFNEVYEFTFKKTVDLVVYYDDLNTKVSLEDSRADGWAPVILQVGQHRYKMLDENSAVDVLTTMLNMIEQAYLQYVRDVRG